MNIMAFAIKGINKNNGKIVYVEDNNNEYNLISENENIRIRKITLYNKISYDLLKELEEKFTDFSFEMVIVNYNFSFNFKDVHTNCYGCIHYNKGNAYSCYGCRQEIQNSICYVHYIKKS